MLVECSKCGAPLDVVEGKRTCKCAYCRATNVVQRLKTIAIMTPAGWVPPKVWTPPEGFEVSGELAYKAGAAVAGVAGLSVVLILVSLLGVCLLSAAFVLALWLLNPDNEGKPWITGPGFTDAISAPLDDSR